MTTAPTVVKATALTHTADSVIMPAGKYVLGDPCYAVPHALWMPWLEAADYMSMNNGNSMLLADIDGFPVLGLSTAYGDGEYRSNKGHRLPVDAGLIGLVPLAVASPKSEWDTCSTEVEFAEPFLCTVTARPDGTLTFGEIVVETGDDASYWEDGEERDMDEEDES